MRYKTKITYDVSTILSAYHCKLQVIKKPCRDLQFIYIYTCMKEERREIDKFPGARVGF